MTPSSATSTFIHICSSQVTYGKIVTINNHIKKQVKCTAKHTPTHSSTYIHLLAVFSSAERIIPQSALVWQIDMKIMAKLPGSIRNTTWTSVNWIVKQNFGWMNVIQMILHYILNFNALHIILTTNSKLNTLSLTVWGMGCWLHNHNDWEDDQRYSWRSDQMALAEHCNNPSPTNPIGEELRQLHAYAK